MTRKTIGLFVASALALIAISAFAYPRDAKDGILYPNLGTFEPNYYKVLKESGQGVVVGRIKGETDPSLWIGANRFPMTGRYRSLLGVFQESNDNEDQVTSLFFCIQK